ncbi:hypothetical protein [Paraglaciecola aestuariivivens]
MKNIVLLALSSAFLLSCTTVSQPIASRPLVEQGYLAPNSQIVSSLNTQLSTNPPTDSFTIQGQNVALGPKYFAATGLVCRKLSSKIQHQIYCQNTKGNWFKVKQVLSEYKGEVMQEAKL